MYVPPETERQWELERMLQATLYGPSGGDGHVIEGRKMVVSRRGSPITKFYGRFAPTDPSSSASDAFDTSDASGEESSENNKDVSEEEEEEVLFLCLRNGFDDGKLRLSLSCSTVGDFKRQPLFERKQDDLLPESSDPIQGKQEETSAATGEAGVVSLDCAEDDEAIDFSLYPHVFGLGDNVVVPQRAHLRPYIWDPKDTLQWRGYTLSLEDTGPKPKVASNLLSSFKLFRKPAKNTEDKPDEEKRRPLSQSSSPCSAYRLRVTRGGNFTKSAGKR